MSESDRRLAGSTLAPNSRRRLRVVVLVDQLGLTGGGERMARMLTLHLDRDRFDRVLCVSRWSEAAAAKPDAREALRELERAGVEVLQLRRKSRFDIRVWRPLIERIRSGRVDILHAHKIGSNVWGAALTTIARPPVFLAHEHTWSYEGNPVRRLLDRELIARRADAFLCVSQEDRRRMIEIERIDPEKIVYLPNGIPPLTLPAHPSVREELSIADDAPVIGAVAILRPQKAVDVLVRASAIVRERFPTVRVLVAGHGALRGDLERLRAELGLDDTVDFLGPRTDVPALLATFDVAALSSDYEGAPLVVMEYMAAGLPIVATRVGGVPDLIEDGRSGLLVDRRSPEQLAAALVGLLEDRETARRLGAEARRRQQAEFSIEAAASRLGDLYERVYAMSPRARPGAARPVPES
jgi:glycosyltransferase involved in cell wall biosynthesis